MRKPVIFLGVALTLGVVQSYGASQTPAQNLEATAQNPPAAAVAENPPDAQSEKPAETHDRKWQLKLGTVSAGAGYSRLNGPFYYPYGLSPFERFYGAWVGDPYWAYPLSHPVGYLGYNDGRGQVKLTLEPRTIEPKLAEVYIDNAFAGTADHLKDIWLDPGAYELSVLSKDRGSFRRRIYVLSGRSLKIAAKLDPVHPGEATESKP